MSNVLPPTARKEIWKFQRARSILVGSLFLLAGAALAFLMLLPSILLTLSIHLQSKGADDKPLTEIQAQNEKTEILRAKALITQFAPVASSMTPTFDALMVAIRARPISASIQSIRYVKVGDRSTIVISGDAANRATISAYNNALSEEDIFKTVSVPVGAFAGAEGGKYSITLTGTF